LNNMALQLQALKRKVKKLDSGAESLEKVDSCLGEIERLSRLVQEFRALSGRRRIVKKPLKMTELLESVLANLMRVSRGVTMGRNFADGQALVLADSDKMQQVLLNLCHNALEAMPNGGRLVLSTECQGSEYVLEVSDTGEGVPDGLDIFEPFVTSKPNGTGLGLAICNEIVRSHEGTLEYESGAQGTVFRMRVPLLPMHGIR
jgi:two-component system, NtrC family, sensor kinase